MKKKEKKPACPRCKVGGYKESKAFDGRPWFTCTKCGHEWSCGQGGGKYKL